MACCATLVFLALPPVPAGSRGRSPRSVGVGIGHNAVHPGSPGSGGEPQRSIARIWNETLLDAIRLDRPKPPVHARNLFHMSLAMWDAWAAYDDVAIGYVSTDKYDAAPMGTMTAMPRMRMNRNVCSYSIVMLLRPITSKSAARFLRRSAFFC